MRVFSLLFLVPRIFGGGGPKEHNFVPCQAGEDDAQHVSDGPDCHMDRQGLFSTALSEFKDIDGSMDAWLESYGILDLQIEDFMKFNRLVQSGLFGMNGNFSNAKGGLAALVGAATGKIIREIENVVTHTTGNASLGINGVYSEIADAQTMQVNPFNATVFNVQKALDQIATYQTSNENILIKRVNDYIRQSMLNSSVNASIQLVAQLNDAAVVLEETGSGELELMAGLNASVADATSDLAELDSETLSMKEYNLSEPFRDSLVSVSDSLSGKLAAETQALGDSVAALQKNLSAFITDNKTGFINVEQRAYHDERLYTAQGHNTLLQGNKTRIETKLNKTIIDVNGEGAIINASLTSFGEILNSTRIQPLADVESIADNLRKNASAASAWQMRLTKNESDVIAAIDANKEKVLADVGNIQKNASPYTGIMLVIENTDKAKKKLLLETQQLRLTLSKTISDLAASLGMSMKDFFTLVKSFENASESLDSEATKRIEDTRTDTGSKSVQTTSELESLLDNLSSSLTDQAINTNAAEETEFAAIGKLASATMGSTNESISDAQAVLANLTTNLLTKAIGSGVATTQLALATNEKMAQFDQVAGDLVKDTAATKKAAISASQANGDSVANIADETSETLAQLKQRIIDYVTSLPPTVATQMRSIERGYANQVAAKADEVDKAVKDANANRSSKQTQNEAKYGSLLSGASNKLAKAANSVDNAQAAWNSAISLATSSVNTTAGVEAAASAAGFQQQFSDEEQLAAANLLSEKTTRMRAIDELSAGIVKQAGIAISKRDALNAFVSDYWTDKEVLSQLIKDADSERNKTQQGLNNLISSANVHQQYSADYSNVSGQISDLKLTFEKAISAATGHHTDELNKIKNKAIADLFDLRKEAQRTAGNLNSSLKAVAASEDGSSASRDSAVQRVAAEITNLMSNSTALVGALSSVVNEVLDNNAAFFIDPKSFDNVTALLSLVEAIKKEIEENNSNLKNNFNSFGSAADSAAYAGSGTINAAKTAGSSLVMTAANTAQLSFATQGAVFNSTLKLTDSNIIQAGETAAVANQALDVARASAQDAYSNVFDSVHASESILSSAVSAALVDISKNSTIELDTYNVLDQSSVADTFDRLVSTWEMYTTPNPHRIQTESSNLRSLLSVKNSALDSSQTTVGLNISAKNRTVNDFLKSVTSDPTAAVLNDLVRRTAISAQNSTVTNVAAAKKASMITAINDFVSKTNTTTINRDGIVKTQIQTSVDTLVRQIRGLPAKLGLVAIRPLNTAHIQVVDRQF